MKYLNLILLLLVSCVNIDNENYKAVENVKNNEIIGEWVADSLSYNLTVDFIKNKKERVPDTIRLFLNDDKTFILENGVVIENKKINQKKYQGYWKLSKDSQKYQEGYLIKFSPKNDTCILPKYLITGTKLYMHKNSLVQMTFIDDPDLGDRILFVKK